jgi:hypothetical protein
MIRVISRSGRRTIAEMEEQERTRTGIGSLKVKFNRVFGYYIEIRSRTCTSPRLPAQQTTAGGERFTTPALKDYEERVLGADERILAREPRSSIRCGGGVAESPRAQDSAASRPRRRCRARGTATICTTSRTCTMATNWWRPKTSTRWWSAAPARRSRERRRSERHLTAGGHPYRAEHGRQVHPLRQTALPPLLAQTVARTGVTPLPLVDRIFARGRLQTTSLGGTSPSW